MTPRASARGVCLLKPSGEAAAAAEGLQRQTPGKALTDCLRPLGGQDLVQVLREKVSEGQISLVIQAAGHHRSVAQHADLIPQSIAEAALAPVRGIQIRPVEVLPRLQPDIFFELPALAAAAPGLGEGRLQQPRFQSLSSQRIPRPEARRAKSAQELR